VRAISFLGRKGFGLLSPFTLSPSEYVAEDILAKIDLKAYARRGAEPRTAELTAELNDIYKAFPDLRRGRISSSGTTPCQPAATNPKADVSSPTEGGE
jgi:hypothetical protein